MKILEKHAFLKIFLTLNIACIMLNIALYYFVDFKSSFIEALDKKDIFLLSLGILCYIFLTILLYFIIELNKKLRHF